MIWAFSSTFHHLEAWYFVINKHFLCCFLKSHSPDSQLGDNEGPLSSTREDMLMPWGKMPLKPEPLTKTLTPNCVQGVQKHESFQGSKLARAFTACNFGEVFSRPSRHPLAPDCSQWEPLKTFPLNALVGRCWRWILETLRLNCHSYVCCGDPYRRSPGGMIQQNYQWEKE